VLHKAIWNWINAHPTEFVSLCQSQRRLAGGPDILFDVFDASADSHKKKMVSWPVQTMLLILCPDILLSITLREENTAVTSTKAVFLSNLRKSLKTKNLADVAAISYVDICKGSLPSMGFLPNLPFSDLYFFSFSFFIFIFHFHFLC